MGMSSNTMIWAVVIFAVFTVGGVNVRAAQSPMTAPVGAPGPASAASDCMTLIYNMSDCLTYVEKGSKVTKPDKPCCPELAGMLDTNPVCLCQLLGKTQDFPIELDVSKALQLPKVCGIQTPPLSLCSVAGIPIGGAPEGAPTSSQGPSSAGMSPEAGEAAGPAAGKNAASNAYFSLFYLVVGLSMALSSFIV